MQVIQNCTQTKAVISALEMHSQECVCVCTGGLHVEKANWPQEESKTGKCSVHTGFTSLMYLTATAALQVLAKEFFRRNKYLACRGIQ